MVTVKESLNNLDTIIIDSSNVSKDEFINNLDISHMSYDDMKSIALSIETINSNDASDVLKNSSQKRLDKILSGVKARQDEDLALKVTISDLGTKFLLYMMGLLLLQRQVMEALVETLKE
jgi:hypothetical protein